jgi:hypothetical protein
MLVAGVEVYVCGMKTRESQSLGFIYGSLLE